MATHASGTPVSLRAEARALLAYPPPIGVDLVAAPHSSALRAASSLTTVVAVEGGRLIWAGALDECMLERVDSPPRPEARAVLESALLKGEGIGKLIRPKALVADSAPGSTVYRKARPWVVLGEGASFGFVAAPLNDAGMGNPRPYQVFLESSWISSPRSKHANLELLHVWSLPRSLRTKGHVKPAGVEAIRHGVRQWYS